MLVLISAVLVSTIVVPVVVELSWYYNDCSAWRAMQARPYTGGAVLVPSYESPRLSSTSRFDKLKVILSDLLPLHHTSSNPLVFQKSKSFAEAYEHLRLRADNDDGGECAGRDDADKMELFGGSFTYGAKSTDGGAMVTAISVDVNENEYDINRLMDSTRRLNENNHFPVNYNSNEVALLGNLFGGNLSENYSRANDDRSRGALSGQKQASGDSSKGEGNDSLTIFGHTFSHDPSSSNNNNNNNNPPARKKAKCIDWTSSNQDSMNTFASLFSEPPKATIKVKPKVAAACNSIKSSSKSSKVSLIPVIGAASAGMMDLNVSVALEKCAINFGYADQFERIRETIGETTSTNGRIALALLWSDGVLSSSMSTTTQKYCTPSVSCHRWNCTCDRNVRVDRATTVFGATFVLSNDPHKMYFLPLRDTSGDVACSSGRDGLVPLVTRWRFLIDTILCGPLLKIIYNSQLVMLPVALRLLLEGRINCNLRNIFDPKVAAYTCDSDLTLEKLEVRELFAMLSVPFEWPAKSGYADVDLLLSTHKELTCLLLLHKLLHNKLEETHCLEVFSKVESRIPLMLAKMELQGLSIDKRQFSAIENMLHKSIAAIEKSAHDMLNRPFNLASPLEVSGILYSQLGLEAAKKTKGGRHGSTSEDALMKLVTKHPVVQLILDHRGMSKLLGTFIDGYKPFLRKPVSDNKIQADNRERETSKVKNFFSARTAPEKTAVSAMEISSDGDDLVKVHAQWNQLSTRTGRLSCAKPNMQQIPNNQLIDSQQINMRSIFRGCGRRYLVAADYSQIEIRVLAHFSGDETMRAFFVRSADCIDGGDVYRVLAAKINGIREDQVTKTQRDDAKVVALGLIYGMSTFGVMGMLDSDLAAATKISEDFLNTFPSIQSYFQSAKASARKNGFVTTLFGRRRHLPGINSNIFTVRSQAERQAVNSIIQGSAADIQKFAMIYVDHEIERTYGNNPLRPRLLLQIHDELIYEIEGPLGDSGEAYDEWLRDECAPFVAFLRKRVSLHSSTTLHLLIS